jgi:hypothetical protein
MTRFTLLSAMAAAAMVSAGVISRSDAVESLDGHDDQTSPPPPQVREPYTDKNRGTGAGAQRAAAREAKRAAFVAATASRPTPESSPTITPEGPKR